MVANYSVKNGKGNTIVQMTIASADLYALVGEILITDVTVNL